MQITSFDSFCVTARDGCRLSTRGTDVPWIHGAAKALSPVSTNSHMSAQSLLCRSRVFCALAAIVFAGESAAKPIALAHLARAASQQELASTAIGSDDDLPLGEAQFDSTPSPLPPNVASLSYAATGTSEFGDLVRLSGIVHYVDNVIVTMSSWAIRSDYPGSSPLGFTHPVTLKLYSVDRTAVWPQPSVLLASVTQPFLIPWRPEPDPTSTSPLRPWRASDGTFYTGLAFNLTFDLGSLGLALPDEVIASVSFNTEHFGSAPLRVPGPYNALHVGVGDRTPEPGLDVEPDAAFWRTARASNYADGGIGGVDLFRHDTGWSPYKPAVRFTDSAYGALAETAIFVHSLRRTHRDRATTLRAVSDLLAHALTRSLWDGNNRLQPTLGRAVFDLLAEAAAELSELAEIDNLAAEDARLAAGGLLSASRSVAETALGDAIISAGLPRRISRAEGAFDEAATDEADGDYAHAIDALGRAWRESQFSLR